MSKQHVKTRRREHGHFDPRLTFRRRREDENPNPTEVEDDGLGLPVSEPIDPADVDEDFGEDDPDAQEEPITEPKEV